jgi:hypothetical protein
VNAQAGGWRPVCPVCGRPGDDVGAGPCPGCGLPAVAHAAVVVARIGATLTDLARDRDALLQTLRAAAPGAPPTHPAAPAPAPLPPSPLPPPFFADRSGTASRRRLSPQEVLLGLGALLVVAAAITFVAVAWSRFGLVFQAGVMLTVTTVLCASSAWTARRGLRATEEALAAAGAALLAVDLAAARALGLFELEDVSLRFWTAVSCGVVVLAALGLGRLTRTTSTWPLVALLAAQPLPFLVMAPDLVGGPAGVAAALALAGADAVVARTIRPALAPVPRTLAALWALAGVADGLWIASGPGPARSWTATAILLVACAAGVVLGRRFRPAHPPRYPEAVAAVGAVAGLALALSLRTVGHPGSWIASGLGLALLTAAVLVAGRPAPVIGLLTSGVALLGVHAALLADERRFHELAFVALAASLPAVLAALRLPALREQATGAALLAPWAAVLLFRADGVLSAPVAGMLLALLGAAAFALATARVGRPEEWVLAAGGGLAGLTAGVTTGTVGAWSQVAVQLALAGAAGGCYAVVARRRLVAVVAVADLVLAVWIGVGGAGIGTPEAYTLPAAAGLLLIAVPGLRAGARSWAAEGAAVGVALVPSALVVVADPTALRLVLVVAAAAALTVGGTVLHRQAPFVIGAVTLLVVTVGRIAPYAPLLPRWLTLGAVGLLLLVVGATYERRRLQAREAVAWVGQMR